MCPSGGRSGQPGAFWGGFEGAPLADIPPSSPKRVGGRKTGGVLSGVAVNLPTVVADWASFYPQLYVFLNELKNSFKHPACGLSS
jgi:hypothetical protein